MMVVTEVDPTDFVTIHRSVGLRISFIGPMSSKYGHTRPSGTVHIDLQFIPKWNCTNAECKLATASITSLLAELIGVAA